MKILWKRLLAGFLALALLLLAYYQLEWLSPWTVTIGAGKVLEIPLERQRVGVDPVLQWTDSPLRLLVLPPAPAAKDKATEVLVADLERGSIRWQEATDLDLGRARHLNIATGVRTDRGGMSWLSAPHAGPQAELEFSGRRFPRPSWKFLPYPDGSTGMRMKNSYFGQMRLSVRESEAAPVAVDLRQTLLNSAYLPGLADLVSWLPGGKFLVVRAHEYGDSRVFVLGPFRTETTRRVPTRGENR